MTDKWASFGNLNNIAAFIREQPIEFFQKTNVLTLDSHKISVSNETHVGAYKVAMVYLSPADTSGFNVCASACGSCKSICLGSFSGHASLVSAGKDYNNVRISRIKKTVMFFKFRELFLTKLFNELVKFAKNCQKNNVIPAFRFNGSSDLPFVNFRIPSALVENSPSFVEYFTANYGMKFYDYTKNYNMMVNFLNGKYNNYHMTFSFTPENVDKAMDILAMGGNVAVAFKTKNEMDYMGKKFLGFTIDNGDSHDLRFLDNKNVIVGLTAKGRKWTNDNTGFFVSLAG